MPHTEATSLLTGHAAAVGHLPANPRRRDVKRSAHDIECDRLRSLISGLGEKPTMAPTILRDASELIVTSFTAHRDTLVQTYASCVADFAHKPHYHAALLAELASRSPAIANDMLSVIGSMLDSALVNGCVARVSSVLRYYACVARLNLVARSTFFGALSPILEALDPLQPTLRRDLYAVALISGFAFCEEHNDVEDATCPISVHYSAVLEKISAYCEAAALISTPILIPVSPTAHSTCGARIESYLACLSRMLRKTRGAKSPLAKWNFSTTTLPSAKGSESMLQLLPAKLPETTLPLSVRLAPQTVTMQLFADESDDNDDNGMDFVAQEKHAGLLVASPTSLVRLMCVGIIGDLLTAIRNNHRDGVRLLMDLKLVFEPGTFILSLEEAQSIGVSVEVESETAAAPVARYNFEILLMEILFDNLLRLPQPRARTVFYTNIVMGLCRIAPKRVASAFARALRVCFMRLENMEPECFLRLVDLFSHHLSNFSYKWSWAEWAPYYTDNKVDEAAKYGGTLPDQVAAENTGAPPAHATRSRRSTFVMAVLERITRLAYHARIAETLPESLRKIFNKMQPRASEITELISQLGNKSAESSPTQRDHNETDTSKVLAPHISWCNQVIKFAANRVACNDMLDYARQFQRNSECSDSTLRHTVLAGLLYHGQTTISHTMVLLERYLPILQALSKPPATVIGTDSAVVLAAANARAGAIGSSNSNTEESTRPTDFESSVAPEIATALARRDYLDCVFGFWKENQQFLLIALDKLLHYRLVHSLDLAQWMLEPAGPYAESVAQLVNKMPLFFFEMLGLCARKILHRMATLEDKLQQHIVATATLSECEVPDKAASQQGIIKRNLQSARREREQLFVYVTRMLLAIATSSLDADQDLQEDMQGQQHDDGARGSNRQPTQWDNWLFGSLVAFLRMHLEEFDGPQRAKLAATVEQCGVRVPETSAAILSLLRLGQAF